MLVLSRRFKVVALALFGAIVLALAPAAVLGHPLQLMSVFDPNYTTLDDGSGSISASGSGAVISGSTYAKRNADSIGVTATLQYWNGSSWSSVGSVTSTDSGRSSVSTSRSFSNLDPGVYRVRTSHWTTHNGVYESGTLTSGSITIN